MAYFLKKTINKKGTYLQIYSSFYDPECGHTAHKAYKPIGYVHELQAKGIDELIAFYKEEVIKLNQELKAAKEAKKAKQISDDSPEKLIGYFPMKNINDKLYVKKYIDLMQTATDFRFNVFDMTSALVYGDSAKYVTFTAADKKGNETDGKIKVSMNEELIKKSLELARYNMLVASEISISDKNVYDAYHNLWRIEEAFRIMKSQLDARPVYLQKKDTITGHFLICYLAVLLTRLFQFQILKNSYCSEDLFEFVHDFRVAKISDRKYINLSRGTTFIKEFSALCNLPFMAVVVMILCVYDCYFVAI